MTITADRSCASLPNDVRMRIYTATIVPNGRPTAFRGTVSGGRFVSDNYFQIGMAGEFANFSTQIVEQLSETSYVVIDGGASAPFGLSGISAPLNAQFLFCPVRPVWTFDEGWSCPTDTGVDCSSAQHQFTLNPR